MTTADRSLREEYLSQVRIKMNLSLDARGMHSVAQNVSTDRVNYGRYAERRAAILSSGYERMGVELAELAAEASAESNANFEILTGEQP